MSARLLLLFAVTSLAVACGSSGDDSSVTVPPSSGAPPMSPTEQPPAPANPSAAAQLADKPWEVISNHGETYLPNVFYADASQNEQIMPWAIGGHVQIDRLIYPTLGNPNLYTKSDATDEFVSVLRVEDTAWDFLGVKPESIPNSSLLHLSIPNDPASGFVFFLVPRGARDGNTEATRPISSGDGTGVYRIYPNDIYMNPIPADMPATLQARKTLRFVFRQGAMASVPAGLYDLRMEIRKDNDFYGGVYEYQYNAIRVFDTEPEEYQAINITDTQVSVGDVYGAKTADKLHQLVQFLNTTNEPAVRNAAFITFNGDLHNGGSPGSLRQRPVATTYADEAKTIVDTLKYLPVPIFLTVGNHDGYVSTGHVPDAVKALDTAVLDNLDSVIDDASPKAWPNYDKDKFHAYLDKTVASDQLGGMPTDIFTGSLSRTTGTGFTDGWKEVARDDRNFILYDGFYQWQKTYGPLNYSWKFGKNFYVSMNSFELRQHRRSGWGMYTVNYGGGMSDVQMAWLDRELLRAKTTGEDIVLLAHHDPRGGHNGEDLGYYFEQVDYRSVYQSAIDYIVAKVFDPSICKLPDWALPREENENCIHDGLQEWMRPDLALDCAWADRIAGVCDPNKPVWVSGVELMSRIAKNPQVRTLLLGHTHYNQLEVLQTGDEFLPGQFPIADALTAQKFATLEVQNPMRAFSFLQRHQGPQADYDIHQLPLTPVAARNASFADMINHVLAQAPRVLDSPTAGAPRELVVLRLVSNADLTGQTIKSDGATALGFAVLTLTKTTDDRHVAEAQVNKATFFVNNGSNVFTNVTTIALDRNARLKPHDAANPVQKFYAW